jgi:hypothetical protein
MKMIVKIAFVVCFLISFGAKAQAPTPYFSGILDIDASNFLLQSKKIQNMNIDISFRFNKLPNIDGVSSFSRFNSATSLNDAYIRYQETYEYTSSSLLLENQIRGTSKIDSFNPNGATDIKNALLTGVFNLIFD